MKFSISALVSICCAGLLSFACAPEMCAQQEGYKGIVPGQATCREVLSVFDVEDCNYPFSDFKTGDSRIRVEFTTKYSEEWDGVCWNLPQNTVIKISIRYNNPIPVVEFPYPLTLVRGPVDDVFTDEFEHKERGLKAFAINNLVSRVEYLPSDSVKKQFSFFCGFKAEIKGSDLPSTWLERFWEKEESDLTTTIENTIREFKYLPSFSSLYIVYFHKSDEDREKGLEKALETKRAFEKSGEFFKPIRIFDGGREKKSEIVLYAAGPLEERSVERDW